jgi:hypothetical protein
MITYVNIKKSVNTLLINEFQIEINSNDVSEGFNRPSFFVSLDNQNKSSTTDQVERTLTIRINYFPSDRYNSSLELMDITERLENVFDLKLGVLDRQFNILEVSSLVTDGVLEFSFDINFYDGRDYDGLENIIVDEIKNGKEFYDQYPIEQMKVLDYENKE